MAGKVVQNPGGSRNGTGRGLVPCTDGSGGGSDWLDMRSEGLWF